MSENKINDMPDDLQSSEMPLKKRKDSRLGSQASTSWRIENSNSGNPLKKRFFRSLLSSNENEYSAKTSKKMYFQPLFGKDEYSVKNAYLLPADEENISSINSNEVLGENTSSKENEIFNLECTEPVSYFSQEDRLILEKLDDNLKAVKRGFTFFAGKEDFSYREDISVNPCTIVNSEVEDLSCKNSPMNSKLCANDSVKSQDALNLVCTNIYDLSKNLEIDRNGLKAQESYLIPEAGRSKEDRFVGTLPISKDANENTHEPKLNSGSLTISQDKVLPSSSLSNYVDYFCNSEINTSSSQPSSHKIEMLLSPESHSRSSGLFMQTPRSADTVFSFNEEDSYNYLADNNLSDPDYGLTSETKKESKFSIRPSSSIDNIYDRSSLMKSPLDFSVLLKNTDTQDYKTSELRGENGKYYNGEITSEKYSKYIQTKLLALYENNVKSFPWQDNIKSKTSFSSPASCPNRSISKSSISNVLFNSNEDNNTPLSESLNVNASSSQEKPLPLNVRFFKCPDNIRNNEDSGVLPSNNSKDKRDNAFFSYTGSSDNQLLTNNLPQFSTTKDKDSVSEEKRRQKLLLKSELLRKLIYEDEFEHSTAAYVPSKFEEEKRVDDELENTLIQVCKDQVRTSLEDDITKQKSLPNDQIRPKWEFFQEFNRDTKDVAEYSPPLNLFTNDRKEDKLKNALIKVCEEELKNSFQETSVTNDPVVELKHKPSPTSSYKTEGGVIDLCSNSDKKSNDGENEGDDDVKVIEVFDNQKTPDLIESCIRPTSSRISSASKLDSFLADFQDKPSTSKLCVSSIPLDMTSPSKARKKSVEVLSSSSSSNHQGDENKGKKYFWDSVLPSSGDDYPSVSSPCSVISISSSSSPSSSPRQDPDQQIDPSIEDEIFGSLIKAMDLNRRKRPSIIARTGKPKEIPVLTLPEDESSDEEMNSGCKKQKLSEKVITDNSSPQKTSVCNESKRELECAICLESMSSTRGTSATTCGHVYCTPCINEVIEKKAECPTCRKALDLTHVHKLFLFT